jgi:uncharacterized protein DUF3313
MIRIQIAAVIALMAFLGGCSTTLQAKDVQPSGFLGEYRTLLENGSRDGTLRKYNNPAANWRAYRKILLEPVVIWDEFPSTLDHQQREDLRQLADAFYDMLYLKLSKDYELVEKPAADAMLIRVAITHAEKSWMAPAFLSKASLELQLLNTLWTYFSGKPAFAGEITVEFTMHDSQTAELLVAGADRRVGGQNPFDKELLNSWGDVKNSLEFWTDLSAYRLCMLKSEMSCVQPKA